MHSMCGRAYMGGPSRLLWFLIGSGATYFWIKHRDTNSHLFPHCHRHRLQVPSANGDWQQSQNSSSIPQTLSDVPRAINNIPPASSVSPPPLHNAQRYPNWDNSWKWDSDREHVEKISKQAIDAVCPILLLKDLLNDSSQWPRRWLT